MGLLYIVYLIIVVILIIVLLKFLFGVLFVTPFAYDHETQFLTQYMQPTIRI